MTTKIHWDNEGKIACNQTRGISTPKIELVTCRACKQFYRQIWRAADVAFRSYDTSNFQDLLKLLEDVKDDA